ncbi:isochorismate synthase [bacterium]|jgi:menaquinone-specific isochorismate synthase|nr:isochorismate synthase [bacterium]
MNRVIDSKSVITLLRERLQQLVASQDDLGQGIQIISIEMGPVSLLGWLQSQSTKQRFYWDNRDGTLSFSALGICADFSRNQAESVSDYLARLAPVRKGLSPMLLVGGLGFSDESSPSSKWADGFGNGRFVLPRLMIIQKDGGWAIHLATSETDRTESGLQQISVFLDSVNFEDVSPAVFSGHIVQRKDLPDRSDWVSGVEYALSQIKAGGLQKVVLSRCSQFTFDRAVDAPGLLSVIRDLDQAAYHFCFQFGGASFIGGTPERLVCREGRDIWTEALAGTAKRSADLDEDYRRGVALLSAKKEGAEHELVSRSIRNSLMPLTTDLTSQVAPELVKLPHVFHLVDRFSGVLGSTVLDGDILSELHPTPAVAGYPKSDSLVLLSEIESHDRGWYAGPVGWLGENEMECVVAIRSGLVSGDQVALYSGAGIVSESDPGEEWDECEAKIGLFLSLFGEPVV